MNLIEDNWKYIQATTAAKAVEIAKKIGRMSDIEDLKQEVLFYLIKAEKRYDPTRSQPKTFINMILTYAQKNLLRRMYRMKRRVNITTVDLQTVQVDQLLAPSSTTADIGDFIEILPEPDRTICRQMILDGISAGIIARRQGKSKDELLAMVREAMRPIAVQIGIRAARQSDGEVTDRQDHPPTPAKPGPVQTGRGSSRKRIFEPTPGEVIPKYDRLSFTRRARRGKITKIISGEQKP